MTIKSVLRITIGVVFLLSASFKLYSIDAFEIYIYSHKILSLNLSYLFARLIISFEFLLGTLIILNIYFKYIRSITIFTLAVFTIYLSFFIGNKNNCHCFGELFKLTPGESIIKNLLLLALIIPLTKNEEYNMLHKGVWLNIIGAICILGPSIYSPPDFIYKKTYNKLTTLDTNKLNENFLNNKRINLSVNEGKKVICFYSTKCRFCKMAERKLSTIVNKNKLNLSNFINIFWGEEKDLNLFFDENSIRFQYSFIPVKEFLEITEGNMPVIILLSNGKLITKYGYRNIDENEIVTFIKD